MQGVGLQQNPDHDGAGVRLGPRIGSPAGDGSQRGLAAFQLTRQGARQPGQVAFEPQRRQPAREQVDRPLAVGQAGPEGDVGQPGGALRDGRLGQVGDRFGAVSQHRLQEIGEDIAPAVPGRRRDPPPRAVRPAGRNQAGARGKLPLLSGGDVAHPVADLGHQRLLGSVKRDDHPQRRGGG